MERDRITHEDFQAERPSNTRGGRRRPNSMLAKLGLKKKWRPQLSQNSLLFRRTNVNWSMGSKGAGEFKGRATSRTHHRGRVKAGETLSVTLKVQTMGRQPFTGFML